MCRILPNTWERVCVSILWSTQERKIDLLTWSWCGLPLKHTKKDLELQTHGVSFLWHKRDIWISCFEAHVREISSWSMCNAPYCLQGKEYMSTPWIMRERACALWVCSQNNGPCPLFMFFKKRSWKSIGGKKKSPPCFHACIHTYACAFFFSFAFDFCTAMPWALPIFFHCCQLGTIFALQSTALAVGYALLAKYATKYALVVKLTLCCTTMGPDQAGWILVHGLSQPWPMAWLADGFGPWPWPMA